jgi:assimilatory nitrate reductase catalytic subunit
MAWLPSGQALALREHLKPLLAGWPHATLLPFGREPDAQGRLGLLLRAAAAEPPPAAVLGPMRTALGLDAPDLPTYQDAARGHQRVLRLHRAPDGTERLQAFWMAGDASGEAWLRGLLEGDDALPVPGRHLLAPGALARQGVAPRSPQVCTCFNVSEAAIRVALPACAGSTDERLAQLQRGLQCGTNCGSCLPTLRKFVQQVPATMAA